MKTDKLRTYFVHWKTLPIGGKNSEGSFTFDTRNKGEEVVMEAYDVAKERTAARSHAILGEGLIITCISRV